MNRRSIILALHLLAGTAATANIRSADAQTLRDAIREAHVPPPSWDAAALDRAITSFAVLDDRSTFLIAYYWKDARTNAMDDTLHLAAYRKNGGPWSRGAIPRRHQPGDPSAPSWDLGSVVEIRQSADYFYLDTHINPSAGALLVLTRDLRPAGAVYGWTLRVLPGNVVLYHASEIHFAPTHSAEVRTFDVAPGRDALLYPQKPYGAVRLRYIAQVRDIYTKIGEDWFRTNNHLMDPERFDSGIQGPSVASADGKSVAFVVQFGDRERGRANTPPLDVVVVCRGVASPNAACVETELASLKKQHPTWPNERILTDALSR